ncbi:MAG: tripartite tricarboxylate transporter substrate binding protein [Burkholderiales bacterium]
MDTSRFKRVCAFVATLLWGGACYAQGSYPVKPVRIVVPSASGGGTDILARVLAQKIGEAFGQQFIVDNRPGAGQMIGIDAVARAPADGYTILMAASTLALNPLMFAKVPYDAERDFAPITLVATLSNVLTVHPSVPARNVQDLLTLARAQPGRLTYSSAGIGTSPHMSVELFKSMANIDMVHVPYKGTGPAMIDLVAGQVSLTMGNVITALPQIKAGRVRALAVTGPKRTSALPDVPTIAEAGLRGYESVQWYGMLAPALTPREIIARLNAEMVRALGTAEVRERLALDGADAVGGTPEAFAAHIRAEIEKWSRVAKAAGIRPQ